ARALRRRRRQVGPTRLRVVADAPRRRLGAAEGALVEEEELEVLPPAERAVDAGLLAEGDRLVVAEGLDASVVQLAAELGDREVVHELVVVPVVVEAGCLAD